MTGEIIPGFFYEYNLKKALKWLYKIWKTDKMNHIRIKKENRMDREKAIQISIFGVIFIISLILWNYFLVGRNNQGVKEMAQATLPMLTIETGGEEINQLHGYSSSVDASMLRESLTPIEDSSFKVITTGSGSEAVSYKLYDTDNTTVIDSGDAAFKEEDKQTAATVRLSERLESGKTYLMELSVTQDGRTIHYFTRVVYGTSFHLKECLDFANQFHDATLDQGNSEFISQYMETKEGTTSNNLSYVDLSSSSEAVTYASLNPQVERVYPATVKEISQNVTSMEIRFILSAQNSDGEKQYYLVNEYFRIRYSEDRMYLLNYERSMEAYMRYDSIDRTNNRILIGIGNTDNQLISRDSGKKTAFVQANELWYYDYQNSQIYKVFSYMGEDYRDSRNNYPEHGIQIMEMDNDGNISFIVYGYMNRGEHEGENGISVYRFSADDKSIEELVFIPTEIQYDFMVDDIQKGAFLSDDNQFYFYLDGSIYHVDIDKNESEIVAKNVTDDMAIVTESGMLAINESASKVKVIDLSSGEEETISAGDGEIIKPIGFIEKDFVYGIGKKDNIVQQKDGTSMYPLDTVYIRSGGKVVKQYGESGSYITEAAVEGTTVTMTRSQKNGNSYKKIEDTYIRYKDSTDSKVVFEYGYSSSKLNQLYLSFPENVYIQTRPQYMSTNVTEQDNSLEVEFADDTYKYMEAYVYTGGKLSGIYANLGDAIKQAEDGGGVVVNYNQMYLWEKGVANSYGRVANISITKAKARDETDIACIKMMADSEGKNLSYNDIKKIDGDTFDKLFEAFDKQAVNYSDCSLDDILYSISKGRSIMARRKDGSYVLIMSYNQQKIRYIDPATGESVQADRSAMTREFEQAGNIFYSYAK